ncbi:MAG: (d)CMP kinase [Planctomycetota bacterium]|nr:MAG: (d)CMP kinase [Planctomycetota bacterium]
MVITIDGPAGSGKSTVARRLAERLGFDFLDTGAMYRAVALACLRRGVPPEDAEAAGGVARTIVLDNVGDRWFLDGQDVTEAIRSEEVSRAASIVAAHAGVREALVGQQRRLAEGRNLITEGRDQGTVVFPDARWKFFLTADEEERARRRYRELVARGRSIGFDEVREQLRQRDERDRRRAIGPLRPADDAIVVDTTGKSVDQVVAELLARVRGERTEDGGEE